MDHYGTRESILEEELNNKDEDIWRLKREVKSLLVEISDLKKNLDYLKMRLAEADAIIYKGE